MVYGMLDAAPDSFPINIDAIFFNQISAERMASMCWTKFEKKTGLVSVSGCKSNPNARLWNVYLSLRSVPSGRRCRSW